MSWDVVKKYGVVMDGVTDNTAALAKIKADINALYETAKPLPRIVFPEGICAFDKWPNLAYPYMQVVAEGQCILKHTGTGDAVVFDGDYRQPTGGHNKILFDGFIIAPNPSSGNGLVINACHRSFFRATVAGAGNPVGGVPFAAISVGFAVCTEIHPEVRAWELPDAPPLSQQNYIGLRLANQGADAQNFTPTQCLIVNPIMEYCSTGILLHHANSTMILNGVCEQCNIGLQMEHNAGYNKALNLDLEGNAVCDFVTIDGAHSNFLWYSGPPQHLKNNLTGWNNQVIHGAMDGVFGM